MAKTTTQLNGKTASELRTMLASGLTTSAAVVAYFETKDKLRAPSQALYDALTGSGDTAKAKVKPAPVHGDVLLDKNGKALKGAALDKRKAALRNQRETAGAERPTTGQARAANDADKLREVAEVAGAMFKLVTRLAEIAG
jgi:hypothetical protein